MNQQTIQHPPSIFFDKEYIDKLIKEEKNLLINELKAFNKRPFYLVRKEKLSYFTEKHLLMNDKTEEEKEEILKFIDNKENLTFEALEVFFMKYSESYRNWDKGDFMKMKKNLKSNQIYKVRIETETFRSQLKRLNFIFEIYDVYHKGDDLETWLLYNRCLNSDCFNVIEKEFKLRQESKRDYYTRYFTKKPFFQFEECGIEVLYARKGYAIDGKKLPSFNRGSNWALKESLKDNNIKGRAKLTKKDDMIKALIKL